MGTGCIGAQVKEEPTEFPAVPPGFTSLTSFTLKRVYDDIKMSDCMSSTSVSDSRQTRMDNELHVNDEGKLTRSLRRRSWINYGVFDNSSDEESDSEQLDQDFSTIRHLPKGVIRGCTECSNCQKVMARWQPENACRPILVEAPVLYPTEEEFKDTLKYIASIRQRAEPFGICRIVPPSSWKPPCPLKERAAWENSRFATRVQRIDKLQNRNSMRKLHRYYMYLNRKRRRLNLGSQSKASNGDVPDANAIGNINLNERFGFEPGPQLTLEAFQKYADDFKNQYFCMKDMETDSRYIKDGFQKYQEPTVENIEGEYWRLVEKPTEEIEVLYGADIETGVYGSGFPKPSSALMMSDLEEEYVNSGWNLNNISRLPGSVLSFESGDISGVLVPWLYVGMCFSSFCWHVEDHHLYSLNYMHWGAPKIWYGVPGKDAPKFEAAMKKHQRELFEEQPDLLHKLVTQLSPAILKSEGVPVYRCVQHPGEFVLTFPRAYHSGFNCGFNCAEAVNVAPVDWLPHGQNAVELYCDQRRKTTVSHDKLLLGAAREAIRAHWELQLLRRNTAENTRWKDVCGKDGILTRGLKTRVDMERARREYFCNSSQTKKMDSNFDATSERECIVCLYDLHLSAVGCQCSPDRFTCLNHAKQLCSCAWGERFFLFRYEIGELNMLVEALGGKLSAIHRWAHHDLGLSLSSHFNKDKLKETQPSYKYSTADMKESELASVNVGTGGEILDKKACNLQLKPSYEIVGESTFRLGKDCYPGSNFVTLQAFQLADDDVPYTRHSDTTSSRRNSVGDFNPVPRVPSSNLNTEGTKINGILACGDSGPVPSDVGGDACGSFRAGVLNESNRTCQDFQLTYYNHSQEVVTNSKANVPVMNQVDVQLQAVTDKDSHNLDLEYEKVANHQQNENFISYNRIPNDGLESFFTESISCDVNSTCVPDDKEIYGGSSLSDSDRHDEAKFSSHLQIPLPDGLAKPNNEIKDERPILDSSLIQKDRVQQPIMGSMPNNLDRFYRHKGPRIAKVVRRINYTVEPLEYGVALSRKLWSTSQAIFPKGFRSRVSYISVLDPTKMCCYISEILDAGLLGPLFMVKVEQCPSEVFIHLSAIKCWDMVRERVNHEIKRQHSLGRISLPTLQPPGSIDGFEMFGFSSPAIIQGIEAIDCNHVCVEYWKSRSSPPKDASSDFNHRMEEMACDQVVNDGKNNTKLMKTNLGTDTVLRGLFRKANPEELHTLHSLLRSDRCLSLIQLLDEEIQSCPQSKLHSHAFDPI